MDDEVIAAPELDQLWIRLIVDGGYLPPRYHCPACGRSGGLGISWRPYEVPFLCAFCGWHGHQPPTDSAGGGDGDGRSSP